MRNIDKIRSMSDSELIDFIYDTSTNSISVTTCECECADCAKADEECKSGVADWIFGEVEA